MKRSFHSNLKRKTSSILDWLGKSVRRVLWRIFKVVRLFAEILWKPISVWWRTRKLARLLWGLPALFIGVTAIVTHLAATSASHNQAQLFEIYQKAAKSATTRGDHAEAKFYLERLIQFPAASTEILFEYAKMAQLTEDYPRMAATLRTLAPTDRAVFAPAHLWQAVQILSQKTQSRDDLKLAEQHLVHTLKLRADDTNAHRLLGEVFFAQGQWNEALPHLLDAIQYHPGHKLMLAKTYRFLNDPAQSARYAEDARQYFSEESAKHPEDSTLQVNWAECCLLLGQHQESMQILHEVLKARSNIEAQRALALVAIAWFDSIQLSTNPDRQFQFELLATGIATYPDEIRLFDRMQSLLIESEELSGNIRELLLKNIVEGRAVGVSHMVLGIDAYHAGKNDAATTHLEQAFNALPNADMIANNFAWLLCHMEPPDINRALALIEPVIKRNPNDARYLDTRGTIYFKAGRYQEAVTDLEMSLIALKENARTHIALAECYEKLKLSDLAQKHRDAAANQSDRDGAF